MFFKQLAAQLYDSCILIALFFAFTAVCLLVNHGVAIPPATRWYQLGLIMLFITYYVLSIVYGGQTIGMRAWRLQLQTEAGNPTWKQALGRLVLTLPAFLASIICIKNPQKLLYCWTRTHLQFINVSSQEASSTN